MKKYLVLLVLVLAGACAVPELVSEIATLVADQDEPPPVLSVSISPAVLMKGTEATIHMRVENPSESDWTSCSLVVGYEEDDSGRMVVINDIPVSLPAGQAFEQDISWIVDFHPNPSARYEIELALIKPDGIQLGKAAIPVKFVWLSLTLDLDPAQPLMGSWVAITVRVTNPSGADLENVNLFVGHGPVNDNVLYQIDEITRTVKAGETFTWQVPWLMNCSLSMGRYQVMAFLQAPDRTLIASAAALVGPAAP